MRKILLGVFLLGLVILITACNPATTIDTSVTTDSSMTTDNITTTEDLAFDVSLNPGVDTVEVGSEWVDAGVGSSESIEITITVIENTVDINTVGAYIVRYRVASTYWTMSFELLRVVVVIDSTPPVLTLNPGIDTVKVGSNWIDAGVEAVDNYFDEVVVTVTGEVDVNIIGTYTITYTATDELGNEASIIRIVDVIN